MENWIGSGLWIVLGVLIGMLMQLLVKRPEATSGHTVLLGVLGAFAAVIGGMLGVGIGAFETQAALSVAGMIGAVSFAALMTWVYRWGIRGML